jgi:hypothetical protein
MAAPSDSKRLAVRISFPLYPNSRTLLKSIGSSESGQKRTVPHGALRQLMQIGASNTFDVCVLNDPAPLRNIGRPNLTLAGARGR